MNSRSFPPAKPRSQLPLLVALYIVAVALPVRYSLGPVQMTGLRTYLAIIFIPLVVIYLRKLPQRGLSIDILMVLFVMWAGVALSQTSPSHALENGGALALELLGGFFLARCYIRTADQLVAVIKFTLIVVLFSLPFAVVESQTGYPPFIASINAIPGLNSVATVNIEPRLGLERVQVMFAHPIHYGLFGSTLTALIYIGTAGRWSFTARLIGLATGVTASFLALSSGAFLSVILQLFLIAWALVFLRVQSRWIMLLAVCVASYIFIDFASNRTPVRVFFSYATFSAHNAYWRGIIFEWGMINVWQNPVFGIGLNDWVRPHYMRSGSMDNYWLVLAVRYGIPGFALFAAAYLSGLVRVAFATLPRDYRDLRRGWVICFIGLTFTLCTVHIWTSIFSFVFFLFGAGLWMLDTPRASKTPDLTRDLAQHTRFPAVPV